MDPKSIRSIWNAFQEVQEKKKLDPVGKEDDDIDNDGDTDSSDEYLKNRRKKIGKSMKKDDEKDVKEGEAKKIECPKCKGDGCNHCDDTGYHMKEDYIAFVESLDDEDLVEYVDWLNEGNLDELSKKTLGSYVKQATKSAAGASRDMAKGDADAHTTSQKRAKGINKAVDKLTRENMDRTELDELSDKAKANYTAAVKKQNASGETDKKATKTLSKAYKAGAKADAHDAKAVVHAKNFRGHSDKAAQGGQNSDMHAKLAAQSKKKAEKGIAKTKSASQHQANLAARSKKLAQRKAMGENAFDIIDQVVESRMRYRLENVLSSYELAAIEEKMKQPNDGAGKGEPFMSTNSAGEKKFYADHQKSNKEMEDKEEKGHEDVVKAGRGVKSQSPTRRGEKRTGDIAMPTPTKAKGQ